MHCQNCNAEVDYNYLTNCPECGCQLDKGDLPKLDPSMKSAKKGRLWTRRLANLFFALSTAFVGMLGGAFVMFTLIRAIYFLMRSAETVRSASCNTDGALIGLLSVLAGGFLGTMAGTAVAIKRPLLRNDR